MTTRLATVKNIYFWSFIVAILIFALGAGVSIYEGIRHIISPESIKNPFVNYIVLGLALLVEGVAWYMAFNKFQKGRGKWSYVKAVQRAKDPSIFVVLFEDSAALLGLLVAFLGVLLTQITGMLWFDSGGYCYLAGHRNKRFAHPSMGVPTAKSTRRFTPLPQATTELIMLMKRSLCL
ncbi:cation diffusion facilitator family transporter [Nitrosomonas aestuarii]|uniref:cation diffusion facilitator family transporter n=1 Tax=Nitrosomonas aestuarii TaxID=52441 RepID=UPI000D41FC0B|nr:cation transporter [Nitrosomonas aestuarii]PTN12811.1 cation efflux family protein [Nitrosomonas aestuarii]